MTIHDFMQIPEHVIQDAADAIKDDSNNSFARLLETASEFKAAGLTPIFMLNTDYKTLIVVIKETFGKKLH